MAGFQALRRGWFWALNDMIEKQRISGTYSSPYEPNPVELHLNPIRLCLIKNAWYLIAQPVDDDKPKTYRVARFDRLGGPRRFAARASIRHKPRSCGAVA